MMKRAFTLGTILLPSCATAFARWGYHPHSAPNVIDVDREEILKTIDILSLDSIRNSLVRQEETVIFALIERAQYHANRIVYEKGGFGSSLGLPPGCSPLDEDDDEELSFFEYMMLGTEVLHCAARRFTSPEEHPFFPERLPEGPMKALPSLQYPKDLLSPVGGANKINFNKKLLKKYTEIIVPSICKAGDDEQHGSTTLCDIAALQALSRRIHYGKFVAESKYRSDPAAYQRLVDAGDAEGVMALLTNAAVEKQVIRRARLKAATYGTEPLLTEMPRMESSSTASIVAAAAASAVVAAMEALDDDHISKNGKIDPAVIESVYRDIIIPLTKEVEVAYLFRRCGKEPPAEYSP